MKSAFGITHEISKSQVSPGRFVRAVDLHPLQRTKIKRRITELPTGGKEGYYPTKNNSAKGRTIWPRSATNTGEKQPKVLNRRHHAEVTQVTGGTLSRLLGRAEPNGRGGGKITLFQGADKHTLAHEQAHIAPRRNPVTAQQRFRDDFRRGREEGRADFTAYRSATVGRYPGSKEFTDGYRDVQWRMFSAARRKRGYTDEDSARRWTQAYGDKR